MLLFVVLVKYRVVSNRRRKPAGVSWKIKKGGHRIGGPPLSTKKDSVRVGSTRLVLPAWLTADS